MAQNDNLKRYLDAGMAFTQLTRERAEALVNDLVKAGEIRRKEAQQQIEELLERSQKNSEFLVGVIRREVADQLRNMGLEDLARRADTPSQRPAAEQTPDSGATQTSAPVAEPPSAAKGAAKKQPAAKKAAVKKVAPVGAKKAAAGEKKAAPAKKAAGKKSAAPPA